MVREHSHPLPDVSYMFNQKNKLLFRTPSTPWCVVPILHRVSGAEEHCVRLTDILKIRCYTSTQQLAAAQSVGGAIRRDRGPNIHVAMGEGDMLDYCTCRGTL